MQLSKQIKNKIKQDALSNLKSRNLVGEINLYLHIEEFSADRKLKAGHKEVSIPRRTALVFADMAAGYNWGHPCQYMLYDANTGESYDSVEAQFPPLNFFTNPENFEAFHMPVKPIDVLRDGKFRIAPIPAITRVLKNAHGNRYAILFSGMSENRHVNDLEFIYRTLMDIYGFNPANIYVLNHNGTIDYFSGPHPVGNWPGDNTPYRIIVNGQGTKAVLENVFDILATRLKGDDFLFVHTNNHGYGPPYDTQSSLCCFPNFNLYYASEFASKLCSLPSFAALMVMMEQCHSGGFLNPIIINSPAKWTHFAAACREDKSSFGGAYFDPFALDWIAGITGHYPDSSGLLQEVDTSHDGRISAAEAFTYADAVKLPNKDTPVSADRPGGYGAYIFLGSSEATHMFFNPTYGGYRVDWCLHWGRDCGKPAADRFCQLMGYAGTKSWQVAPDIGNITPTYVLGDGKICNQDLCDGFAFMECSGQYQPPVPQPSPPSPPQPSTPWDDPTIRSLIDEWLTQVDRCVKRLYPGCYIDKWGRMCGKCETTIADCSLNPDHPPGWDNYRYVWEHGIWTDYYPYTVKEYVSLRQKGESFSSMAKCKRK